MQSLLFQHTSTILRDRLATLSFSFYTIIPGGKVILVQYSMISHDICACITLALDKKIRVNLL